MEWKHRVILDLKLNGVNAAAETPERQVLPSVFDHGRNLALQAGTRPGEGEQDLLLESMVLDFKDAFMPIPLAPSEHPCNTCFLEVPTAGRGHLLTQTIPRLAR